MFIVLSIISIGHINIVLLNLETMTTEKSDGSRKSMIRQVEMMDITENNNNNTTNQHCALILNQLNK